MQFKKSIFLFFLISFAFHQCVYDIFERACIRKIIQKENHVILLPNKSENSLNLINNVIKKKQRGVLQLF